MGANLTGGRAHPEQRHHVKLIYGVRQFIYTMLLPPKKY
jgi:hypothetical protein